MRKVFDKVFTKIENYTAFGTDKLHKVIVTGLILGTGYGAYTLIRDYR